MGPGLGARLHPRPVIDVAPTNFSFRPFSPAFCWCALCTGAGDSGPQENPFVVNGARRGAPGAGAFGAFRPPPPPGSQFATSRFRFYTHIPMPNSAASSMASSSSSSSPTASRTREGNGPVLYGLVPGSRSLLGVGVRAAAARRLRRRRAPPAERDWSDLADGSRTLAIARWVGRRARCTFRRFHQSEPSGELQRLGWSCWRRHRLCVG